VQIISPPNSVKPIRFEIYNHVTMMIYLSVDPCVMSGEYWSVFSCDVINLSPITVEEYWGTVSYTLYVCNHDRCVVWSRKPYNLSSLYLYRVSLLLSILK